MKDFAELLVQIPREIYETLQKDSEMNLRTEAAQLVWILREYYKGRVAELFSLSQLHEDKPGPVPVIRSPDPHEPGPLSRLREKLGQGENE